MHRLEYRIYARDISKRVVRPFEWGLNFLGNGHLAGAAGAVDAAESPRQFFKQFNAEVLAASDGFFTPPPIDQDEFEFDGNYLCFPSGIATPYQKNNLVHARFFPAGSNDRAVIISPNWNAVEESHVSLCRLLNRFGISALRLSLPYHDRRMPEELSRADYMVSANIGRTIQAVRQAVFDIRRAADWLQARGATRIGVMGSSIGSCVSWLAFIHDERLQTGVFNLISSWFGDVVWRALTTHHVRKALETELTAQEVREVWTTISPSAYMGKLERLQRPALFISANYDLTFLPELTKLFLDECQRLRVPIRTVFLPCGHYTIGMSPFKYLDAWHIVNFFRRNWKN